MTSQTDVDSEPSLAVSSLRSKFERLAHVTTSNSQSQGRSGAGLVPQQSIPLVAEPTSPRQRAASGSDAYTHSQRSSSGSSRHLRSTSSSSDLQDTSAQGSGANTPVIAAKRKPPPPPAKVDPSPAASSSLPTNRPVPNPRPVAPTRSISSSVMPLHLQVDEPDLEPYTIPHSSSVSSLRAVFAAPSSSVSASPPRAPTPRASTPRQNLTPGNSNPSSPSRTSSPKATPQNSASNSNIPAIPPRPPKSLNDSPRILPSPLAFPLTLSPESSTFASDSASSPSPPALPARRSMVGGVSNEHGRVVSGSQGGVGGTSPIPPALPARSRLNFPNGHNRYPSDDSRRTHSSNSSRASSESDTSTGTSNSPSLLNRPVPALPRRPSETTGSSSANSLSASQLTFFPSSPSSSITSNGIVGVSSYNAPPLPTRRPAPQDEPKSAQSPPPPRLPFRAQPTPALIAQPVSVPATARPVPAPVPPRTSLVPPPRPTISTSTSLRIPSSDSLNMRSAGMSASASSSSLQSPSTIERRSLLSSRLPPPPTRMIALGAKLPPARRPPSPSSDEESGGEEPEDTKAALPDSSRSSRRPPVLHAFGSMPSGAIHVPHHTGFVAVKAACVVVATHHHVRIYDLERGRGGLGDAPVPIVSIDMKDCGLGHAVRVTCMEWSSGSGDARYLWLGTREGHLLELDVTAGLVVGTKPVAHAAGVSHIFRHAGRMVTLDETGKVLVFEGQGADGRVQRLGAEVRVLDGMPPPRVVRIAEKQGWAGVFGGKLWTSAKLVDAAASGANSTSGAARAPGAGSRTAILRVYDVFAMGCPGSLLSPTDHAGAVTCGTILPSDPGRVYFGHEGGFISIWDDGTGAGNSGSEVRCLEVMKVSASDVLSLAGVNNRLWAGGRTGLIAAYDVQSRPWVITNQWMAHSGLPVAKIEVDICGIEGSRRVAAWSIGRDEVVRFWDGLLKEDWIDQELLKREASFSGFRDLRMLVVSWNVDAARPDAEPEIATFLQEVLQNAGTPDVISFGLQEVIDLESRKMAAKSVILGRNKKADEGGLSDKVTGAYKRWHECLLSAMRQAFGQMYTVMTTESLVGLFSCVFVKVSEKAALKGVAVATVKRGLGGRYGNKGGIISRFVIEDSSVCLINVHLAAGHHHVRQRNSDIAAILEEKALFPVGDVLTEAMEYVGGGDGSMVLDHELVFISGDMNYRIDQRRDVVVAAVEAGSLESLLPHDQLLKEMKHNRGFRLRAFCEGPLTFAPTYKYDRHSSTYDSSEKRRVPAWCDRVLWRTRDPARVRLLGYQRFEPTVSDHRPVVATFVVIVKSVKKDARLKSKKELESTWSRERDQLVNASHKFYVGEGLI